MSVQEPNSYYTQGFGTAYQKVEIPVISSRDPTIYDGVAPHSMPLGKRWINSPTGSTWELTSVYSVNGEMRAAWSQTSGAWSPTISTLTGDTGGAITPNADNINILGHAYQLAVAGSGHTLTVAFVDPTIFPGDITCITGNIKTNDGSLTLGTAGNKINIQTGSNASCGVSGAMTAGSITISTTAVTDDSLIFVQPSTLGTVTAPKQLYAPPAEIVDGTSFTVHSADATDTSTVQWWLFN